MCTSRFPRSRRGLLKANKLLAESALEATRTQELCLHVNLRSDLLELFGFLAHSSFKRRLFIESLFRGEIAHVLGNLHGAEMRAAHRAEVRLFRAFLRQRFVVEFTRGLRVQREV